MGIIVGSKTHLECDSADCKEFSNPQFEQSEAVEAAYQIGWFKDESKGSTFCPRCKGAPIIYLDPHADGMGKISS